MLPHLPQRDPPSSIAIHLAESTDSGKSDAGAGMEPGGMDGSLLQKL